MTVACGAWPSMAKRSPDFRSLRRIKLSETHGDEKRETYMQVPASFTKTLLRLSGDWTSTVLLEYTIIYKRAIAITDSQ